MTSIPPTWFIVRLTLILTPFLPTHVVVLSALAEESVVQQTRAWNAAVTASQQHDYKRAIEKTDEAMKAGLTNSMLFRHRGRWFFRAGDMQASLKAFNRYIEMVPSDANSQWERGITCYYAGQYRAGAQQFVDYQTYHDSDVENAVWRYLCQLKFDGKEKARNAILPIKGDTRVPMMEIYKLFRRESTPAKVMAELAKSKATGDAKKHQTFDAHLYLALFYESEDDLPNANEHIDLAVEQFKQGDYMWAVAIQHQRLLKKRTTDAKKKLAE